MHSQYESWTTTIDKDIEHQPNRFYNESWPQSLTNPPPSSSRGSLTSLHRVREALEKPNKVSEASKRSVRRPPSHDGPKTAPNGPNRRQGGHELL
eukprot:2531746-Pyramimonas_sp.AAC.1